MHSISHLKRYQTTAILLSVIMPFSIMQTANAASGGGESCSLGRTLFTDALYGMGAGLVIGGLILVAQDKKQERIPSYLATAGLIGGGIGAGIGAAEFSLSNCTADLKSRDKIRQATAGFQIPKLFVGNVVRAPATGLSFSYILNQ